jgi:1,4-alpha-glucan branching enzyme
MHHKPRTAPAAIHPVKPEAVPVRFDFADSRALAVAVAGSFNDWNPTAGAMHSTGDGAWLTEAALLPGVYEYCLIVDGRWMPDPLACESVPNPFGGRNSVLKVSCSPAAAHLYAATFTPLTRQAQ